ncbi:MAG: hypothetical protein HOK41_13605 [Nitrospina sp.]|jgi:hypothetical protein|nr:hypothetical protein [Nitrospina sp.]MBT6718318.1 hypothetical protein [Nitrospina sp.]
MKKLLQRFPILIACIIAILFATAGQAVAAGGPVILSGDDADDRSHCEGSRCGQLYGKALSFVVNNSQSNGSGIVAIGVNSSRALSSLNSWNNPTNGGPGVTITHARTTAEISSVDFSNFAMIYIPSDSRNTSGGMTSGQLTTLNSRQTNIVDFVNNQGGGLLALTEAGYSHQYNWLPLSLNTSNTGHSRSSVIRPTAEMDAITPGLTASQLSHCCFHTVFTGPPGFSGLKVLAYHDHNGNGQFDGEATDHVIILGGVQITIQGNISLSPATAALTTGDQHTVTASAEDGNPLAPIAGATVTFVVSAGPNAGASGTCNNGGCTTDANGQVSFTYTGANAGTDSIVASFVDGNGETQTSNTTEATFETPPNEPPIADAGSDQIIEQTGPGNTAVILDGSGSSDPDSDPLTYAWSGGASATGANPTVNLAPGTHNITLIVNDGTVDSAADTVQIIVQDTIAPAITTTDRTVEATGATTPVDVSGDASATDAVTLAPVLTNNSTGSFTIGSHTVIWTACDAVPNCSEATQTVTVVDTTPPAITTQNLTVEATGTLTAVDIASVTDATDAVGVVSLTNNNAGPYPVGSTTVTWTACDAVPNCSEVTQIVTVLDTTPPEISNACLTDKLWPPNHKMVLVSTGSVSDIADPDATFSIAVTSNQPINGTGDGNTDPDWEVDSSSSDYEVSLRAERAGNIGQRDYTITVTATDASDNTSTATCSASVPHDQGNNNSPAAKKGKK